MALIRGRLGAERRRFRVGRLAASDGLASGVARAESRLAARLVQVLLDPGQEVRDSCIHAGILALAAANSPAHNADLGPATIVHHQGATTVSLQNNLNLAFIYN